MTDQSRQLDGDINAGNRPFVIAVRDRIFGPAIDDGGQALNQFKVLSLVFARFSLADHGFAEEIEREGKSTPTQLP